MGLLGGKIRNIRFAAIAATLAILCAPTCGHGIAEAAAQPFSKLAVAPGSGGFPKIIFGKTAATESRTFTVKNTGTAAMTVTVGTPSSPQFIVTEGAGETSVSPKSSFTVTVEFAPNAAGTFSDSILVSSDATKGATSKTVKLHGKAEGNPPVPTLTATPTGATPTLTPTPTLTATPTATNTPGPSTLFVSDFLGYVIGFPSGDHGNVAPTVTIAGNSTALQDNTGIAIDLNGNLYVANSSGGLSSNGSITSYAFGSNGDVAPTTNITGSNTGLSDPQGITVDSLGNIYVTNAGNTSITVYSQGSNGDAAPVRTITGFDTLLSSPSGIAIDSSGRIFVANNTGGPQFNGIVTVYPAGSSGDTVPIAAIGGSNTLLGNPYGIALDSTGNIFVASEFGGGNGRITAYSPGSSGNVSPDIINISGSNTGLDFPNGIALDSSGNIFVANNNGLCGGSITMYSAGSSGNITPTATIEGCNTTLDGPVGIVLSSPLIGP